MLNLNSILKESDFTQQEKELIQLHIDNNSLISWETMQEAWRDSDGYLCIRYSFVSGYSSSWYHYNIERREWW